MSSKHEEVLLKQTRDSEDDIIISDSILRNTIPPQLKNMTAQYKVMCGCECCIYSKRMHSSLITWRDCHIKKFRYINHNAQNRSSGKLSSRLV